MAYKVVLTEDAEADLDELIGYLMNVKKNPQAAAAVMYDFRETFGVLKEIAGSLRLCENPRLKDLGYHRINFQRHRYFMMYRIAGDTAYVDDIFHELQDYENSMI